MWTYWKEQYLNCKNKDTCDYRKNVQAYINKLSILDKTTSGVYGTLRWNCNYFYPEDKEEEATCCDSNS